MKESLYFVYDGINSYDMGIIQVNTNNGLYEEPFLHQRNIVEEKIRGRDTPYFYDIEREPLTINMELFFDTEMTDEKIREVARWLNQNYYKELYFSEAPDRRFYTMYTGSPTLLHNGIKEGYIQIEMRCNSPYSYSPIYISDEYDCSVNPTSKQITFTNNGDVECKPIMYIKKIGDGDISIVNNSNGGQEFRLTGLFDQEFITVDNENEEIETDIPGMYRYNNHNDVFLSMVRGVNYLTITGTCILQFKYQFKTLG
jgi:predicted phage tail component-like protein